MFVCNGNDFLINAKLGFLRKAFNLAPMIPSVQLSDNGPLFSRLVAGVMTWGQWGKKLDANGMLALVETCLSFGITTFDHADIYGDYTTEAEFGAALAGRSHLRTQMQLVSKCGIKLVSANRPSHRVKSYDTSCAPTTSTCCSSTGPTR
jgi:predicted oxidoreductase